MDRYDRVMTDVRRKTEDEDILWKVVSADHYSDVLLNSGRAFRAFTAEYPVGKKTYKLLFAERKIENQDDDSLDMIVLGLLVLDDDRQIVLNLYEGLVDRDDLLRLSGLIDAHNDRARDFFEAFDQFGAA